MRRLSGRKCLITGAGSGIGRATAQAMATRGAQLYLTDLNE
jgi:NAD(P)-dependent dehydrogenase (short-subunit alcohol dehydrogenase family)